MKKLFNIYIGYDQIGVLPANKAEIKSWLRNRFPDTYRDAEILRSPKGNYTVRMYNREYTFIKQ